MTTAAILSLAFTGLVVFALLNLFFWALEFLAAFIKCMIDYFKGNHRTWHQNYFWIRLLFTSILLKVSFAELTPKQLWVHKQNIQQEYHNHLNKKNLRKEKHKKLHKIIK